LNASEQTQISVSVLILSRAGVFITPELIKTVKICQLHGDRFGIYWKSSSVKCKHPIHGDTKRKDDGGNMLLLANVYSKQPATGKYLIHIFVNIWRKSQCFLSFFKPYPSLSWTLSTTFFELLVCDNKFEFRTLHLLIHICLTDSDLSQVLSDMNFIEQQLAATTASYRSFIK
jgi:hypothetical protein